MVIYGFIMFFGVEVVENYMLVKRGILCGLGSVFIGNILETPVIGCSQLASISWPVVVVHLK